MPSLSSVPVALAHTSLATVFCLVHFWNVARYTLQPATERHVKSGSRCRTMFNFVWSVSLSLWVMPCHTHMKSQERHRPDLEASGVRHPMHSKRLGERWDEAEVHQRELSKRFLTINCGVPYRHTNLRTCHFKSESFHRNYRLGWAPSSARNMKIGMVQWVQQIIKPSDCWTLLDSD